MPQKLEVFNAFSPCRGVSLHVSANTLNRHRTFSPDARITVHSGARVLFICAGNNLSKSQRSTQTGGSVVCLHCLG